MTTTGPRSQKPWQPVRIDIGLSLKALLPDLLYEGQSNLLASPGPATCPSANGHTGLIRVSLTGQCSLAGLQILVGLRSFNVFPPSGILFQDLFDLGRGQFSIVILVDQKHRRKGAGPQTGHGFKGEFEIGSRLVLSDAQELLGRP